MAIGDQLLIDVHRGKERVVLALRGELDLANAPLLESEIDGEAVAAARLLVLDLRELTFIDSTGLRVLLAANERAGARGQEFALIRGSEQVQRLLSITGVDSHLRVLASTDELAA